MAKRGPKPKTLGALKEKNSNERALFRCLGRTRIMHKNNIDKHFPGIDPKRLKIMFRDGWLIEKEKGFVILGSKGIKYLENNMGMKYRYTSKKTADKHDLILNRYYLEKCTLEERESWRTENEERRILHSQKEFWDMSHHPQWGNPNDPNVTRKFIPDATIERNGKRVVLEVVTRHYTQNEIDQKVETANVFYGSEIELITK
jgi:hypothetical protein